MDEIKTNDCEVENENPAVEVLTEEELDLLAFMLNQQERPLHSGL